MKKIGIITLYHNSVNYGGVLQAYAMQKKIENYGFEAKQIDFEFIPVKSSLKERLTNITFKEFVLKVYYTIKYFIQNQMKKISSIITNKKKKDSEISKLFECRTQLFKEFRAEIPHTKLANESSIKNISSQFDAYIVGSDQVWHPYAFCPSYYLDFAGKDKRKIAYAASMAVNKIEKEIATKMMPLIQNIDAVSVREKKGKEIINSFIDKQVEVVLDPTLLLEKEEWEKVVREPFNFQEKDYIFVYLLGDNKQHRDLIEKIAKSENKKIVFLPHVHGIYQKNDVNFADVELYDVGPKEFLYLILNASVIFTDSFHGAVFSTLFEKQYYVLKRFSDKDKESMNSRLDELFSTLEFNRYISDDKDYLSIKDMGIDYAQIKEKLKAQKKKSELFLTQALSGVDSDEKR